MDKKEEPTPSGVGMIKEHGGDDAIQMESFGDAIMEEEDVNPEDIQINVETEEEGEELPELLAAQLEVIPEDADLKTMTFKEYARRQAGDSPSAPPLSSYAWTFFSILKMATPSCLVSLLWGLAFAQLTRTGTEDILMWLSANPAYWESNPEFVENYVRDVEGEGEEYNVPFVRVSEWQMGSYSLNDPSLPPAHNKGPLYTSMVLQIVVTVLILLLPLQLFVGLYTRIPPGLSAEALQGPGLGVLGLYDYSAWRKAARPFLFVGVPGICCGILIQVLQSYWILEKSELLLEWMDTLEVLLACVYFVVMGLLLQYQMRIGYALWAVFIPLFACFLTAFIGGVFLIPVYKGLDEDWKKVLFRVLAWPFFQEFFIAIPRLSIRRVPEGFIEKDASILAPLPVMIGSSFFGRFLLANVRGKGWMIVVNLLLMCVETSYRLTIGWRDRLYARYLARMKIDAMHDLFGATWAVQYRCIIICIDMAVEYINIISACTIVFIMNVGTSPSESVVISDLFTNIVIQIVCEIVTDSLCIYIEAVKYRLPINKSWEKRVPGLGFQLFLSSIIVCGYASRHTLNMFCPIYIQGAERTYRSLYCTGV